MIIPILLLAFPFPCTVLSAGTDRLIEDGSILQRYDLRSVLPSFDAGTGWSQTMHEGFDALDQDAPFIKMPSFYEGAAPELISELITLILGDELHHEGREVSLDGNSSLLVLAPPEVQKRVALVLAAFEQAFSSHTQLQVDVLDLDGGDFGEIVPNNVIALGDADRFVESLRSRGARHRRHSLNLSPGRTAILWQQRSHSLIVDYDVEIAERAVAFDPKRLTVHEGLQLFARGVPSPGGTHLSILFADAEFVDGPKEVEALLVASVDHDRDGDGVEVSEPRKIQSGHVMTRSIACTTFLGDDSALVFGSSLGRAGENSTQVFVLRRGGGVGAPFRRVDIPDSARSLLMVNTEILGIPDFEFDTVVFGSSERGYDPHVFARLNTKPTSFLSDWLKYRFSVWRQLGPWAIIVTDPAWNDASAASVDKLIGSIRPAVDVLSATVEFGTQAAAGDPFRWSMPVLPGFDCGLVLGYSSTAMVDLDVEVAQGASAYDPVIASNYHGLKASFGVSFQGQSRFLDVRGSGMWPGQPMGEFKPGGVLSTALQQPVSDMLGFDERRVRAPGEAFRFGAAPSDTGSASNLYVNFEFAD